MNAQFKKLKFLFFVATLCFGTSSYALMYDDYSHGSGIPGIVAGNGHNGLHGGAGDNRPSAHEVIGNVTINGTQADVRGSGILVPAIEGASVELIAIEVPGGVETQWGYKVKCARATYPQNVAGCDEYDGPAVAAGPELDPEHVRCNKPVHPDSQMPTRVPEDCHEDYAESDEEYKKRLYSSNFCSTNAANADCQAVTTHFDQKCNKPVDPQSQMPTKVPEDCPESFNESDEAYNQRLASSDFCQQNPANAQCAAATTALNGGDTGATGNNGSNSGQVLTQIPADVPGFSVPSVLEPGSGFDGDLRSQGIMSGTGPYKACQKLVTSSVNWGDSVGKAQDQADTSIFTKSWNVLFKEHQQALIAKVRSYAGQEITPNIKANLAKEFQAAVNAAHERYAVLNGCVGLLMVTDDTDNYSDEELKRVTDGKMTKKSMDGKITCQAAGPETQDWGPCKTLVNTYNAAAVGQVVAQEAQKLDYMDKELETQTDLMADGGKDPTKALKSQESMVRKQAQIANQRAAFHGAKLAALLAAKEAMPTKDEEYGSCQASTGIQTSVGLLRAQYNHFVGAFKDFAGRVVGAGNVNFGYEVAAITNSESSDKVSVKLNSSLKEASDEIGEGLPGSAVAGQIGSDSTWAKTIEGGDSKFSHPVAVCDSAIYDRTNVIMNSEAIEQANQALVQAGVDMAANIAKGQILDNQADRIADAADGIKQFDPGEMPMFQEEDAQVTACQADPMSEACLELENTRGVGYAGSSFNFGGANRATTPGSVADDGDGTGDASASSNGTDRSGVATKMGRSIAAVNKGGGIEGKASRAGVKKKSNPGGAGGGGGGGSGGAAPPSGGGVKGGGGPGGARSAYKGKKVRYRGGAGGLSFSGGNSKSRSKKKSANPFASLLGKKGKKKGGTLNFRNPASIGKKGGSLFQMISKRYSVVTSKKQLLEYEDKK